MKRIRSPSRFAADVDRREALNLSVAWHNHL